MVTAIAATDFPVLASSFGIPGWTRLAPTAERAATDRVDGDRTKEDIKKNKKSVGI